MSEAKLKALSVGQSFPSAPPGELELEGGREIREKTKTGTALGHQKESDRQENDRREVEGVK